MKNKHPKREMASKMLTKQERKFGVTPFDSFAWMDRSRIIRERVKQK